MRSSIRRVKSAACETRHKALVLCVAAALLTGGSYWSARVTRQSPPVDRQSSISFAGFGFTASGAGLSLQAGVDPVVAGQNEPGLSHRAAGPVEEEHAGRGIVDVIARLINFGLLVGILVYFLKSPIRSYLSDRSEQIRTDLVNAAKMRETAAAQIAEIDDRMKALPAELEALRRQGAEDIAAEEVRIREAAAAERERLLEQARREIDLQVKVAERGLVAHAAELAVGVASERIKRNITDEDQKRLVERYVQQLRIQN